MTERLLALSFFALTFSGLNALAQDGGTPTQALVTFASKTPAAVTVKDITVKVDNHNANLLSLAPVAPGDAQVALLLDDGLRTSIGGELNNLRAFITSLPQGTQVFVGFMENGRVVPGSNSPTFTTDLAAAAQGLRLPLGVRGASASPYFSLSDFVKNWPGSAEGSSADSQQPNHKARFVLMITNGVDPYNGSTSILNQDSPYVAAAVTDAQRAGVAVYSIYYSDVGFRFGRGTFSGQSYLSQVAEGTGGSAYYEGYGNPVSLIPFLNAFKGAVADTFVATFPVESNKKLVTLKVASNDHNLKVKAPNLVRPGTVVLQ